MTNKERENVMNGKKKCKILKEIRQKIADENEIPFVTAECRYKGNCKGTCPKCEAEVAYLEKELLKRKKMGKRVIVAGVATSAILLSLKGCQMVANKAEEKLIELAEESMEGFASPDDMMVIDK